MPKLLLDFVVWGEAVPQGSMSNYGHGRVTHSKREKLMDWRRSIQLAAQAKAPQFRHALVKCPVAIVARFYSTRPSSAPKKAVYKRTAPDADKLCRAVGDALEKTVLVNDSCIVAWYAVKLYCDGASHSEIEVWELEAADHARVEGVSAERAMSEALPFVHGP
jgi:Holliday junction resolvase RusA-like endonuclease